MFFDQLSKEAFEQELEQVVDIQIMEVCPKQRFLKYNEIIARNQLVLSFKGYDASSGKEITWNIVSLDMIPVQKAKAFIKIIKKIEKVDSPHVVKYIDSWFCKERRELIFISEYMNGGTLDQHIKRVRKHKLNILKGWCNSILKGALDVSSTCEDVNIVINCSNIYINSNSNQVKLGLMCFIKIERTPINLERKVVISIDIPWLPPEAFDEKNSLLTTVYSFGMTLLQILTKSAPYSECRNYFEVVKSIVWRTKPFALKKIGHSEIKKIILNCITNKNERIQFKQLCDLSFWKVVPEDTLYVSVNQKIKQEISPSGSTLEIIQVAQISHKPSNNSSHKSLQTQFQATFNYKTQTNSNFKLKIISSDNLLTQFEEFVIFFINKFQTKQYSPSIKLTDAETKEETSQLMFSIKNCFTEKYKEYLAQIQNIVSESSIFQSLLQKKIEMQKKQIKNLQKDFQQRILQKHMKNKKNPMVGLDMFDIIQFNLTMVEVKQLKKGLSSTSDILNLSCSSIYPQNKSQKSEEFDLDFQKNNWFKDHPHHSLCAQDEMGRLKNQENHEKIKSCQWTRSQKIEFEFKMN